MTTHIRRRLGMAGLLLLVPTAAACGFSSQTNQSYQPAWGTNNRAGQVYVLNSVVVSDKNGTGTWAGTLSNNSVSRSDKLVSITGGKGTISVTVPPGGEVNLAKSGQVQLSGSNIKPGVFIPLTLKFSSGQVTKIDTPVYPHSGDYASVPVGTSSSSASAKPSKGAKSGKAKPAKASSSASPSAGSTPSPSSSTSPSASPTK